MTRFFSVPCAALAVAVGLAITTPIATAAPQSFDFKDPKGVNNVTFKLDAPLETITGSASGVSGTLTIDRDNPSATKGAIVVAAPSMHVENATMKEHMHGKDWLDSKNHPEIKFTVTGLSDFKMDGDTATAIVSGTFSLKGKEKVLTAPAKVTLLPGALAKRSNGAMQGDLLVIRCTFTIKRSEFGINPAAPTDKVADEIEISLAIAGASPKK
ncbi:MAG: YceI family protein [Verrucomicrobiales bacterium]